MNNEEPIKDALKDIKPVILDVDKDYERLQEVKRLAVNHSLYQEGPYLLCSSCERRHTVYYLGANKSFKGFDQKGEMIITKRF